MRPFEFTRADSAKSAILAFGSGKDAEAAQFIAGGTTLLDLMKLDVMRPQRVVDINALHDNGFGDIDLGPRGLRLGAMVRMDVADGFDQAFSALNKLW